MINQPQHKNKTVAALLASLSGGIGLHHFYLSGNKDKWAWLHFISLPISLFIFYFCQQVPPFFSFAPLTLSVLTSLVAGLVIGTTSDEKWDAKFNPHSSKKSDTGWPIALILALTLGIGAAALIAVIARTFDLLFTGGIYG